MIQTLTDGIYLIENFLPKTISCVKPLKKHYKYFSIYNISGFLTN
jgi:hypothetical protein